MQTVILFLALLCPAAQAGDDPIQTQDLKEVWICLAQDRAGDNFTSGYNATLAGAQKQALEFCYSFSEMPATCRMHNCEKTE